MKEYLYVILLLPVLQLKSQVKTELPYDSIRLQICNYSCTNQLNTVYRNCLSDITYSGVDYIDPEFNVNPYEEFGMVLKTLQNFVNNPFNHLFFSFLTCDTLCNAAAVSLDDRRYILYSRKFLNSIRSLPLDKKWVVRSIIAHEIGHHILNHTLPGREEERSQFSGMRQMELRADFFSGFMIRQFPGSTIENALAGINSLPESSFPMSEEDETNSTHPMKRKRNLAIEAGFSERKENPIYISMFKKIDSLALAVNKDSRRYVMHTIDEAISYGDWKKANELIKEIEKNNNYTLREYDFYKLKIEKLKEIETKKNINESFDQEDLKTLNNILDNKDKIKINEDNRKKLEIIKNKIEKNISKGVIKE